MLVYIPDFIVELLIGEDSPSEYGSIRSDDQETSSEVRYILPSRCQLDEEDEVGIDALVAKIQPEIPLLVVQMKKSNVNGPQATLVTPILHWVTALFVYSIFSFSTDSFFVPLTYPDYSTSMCGFMYQKKVLIRFHSTFPCTI
jgi:hypothetical protein